MQRIQKASSAASSDFLIGNALCWENIKDFTAQAFKLVSPADAYAYNWHIGCVAEHLHAVHEGQLHRLIINIPPRSLKSIMVSVAWPAWLLGKDPRTRIIAASYAQNLATKHSLDTRLILESEWYGQLFPDTKIADDQNEKANFMTTKRGFRKATSTGGSILGDGADYLIADDLIKADEALSDTVRDSTNRWFDQSFITRMNQPKESRAVVVMQRLHAVDLTGHLIEKGSWHLLKIPAEARKKVFVKLGEKEWTLEEGELLHPDRLGRAELDTARNDLGEYAYAGQFLQEPVPDGGAEFQVGWYQMFESIQSYKGNLYLIVDPAGDKKKKTSDYTAMRLWMLGADRNYYLCHTVRDRLNTTERVNKIFEIQRKFSELSGKPVTVLYKTRSFITEFHSMKERMNQETYHFPLIEVMERGEKNERIRRMIPAAESRRMWIPRTYTYVDHTKKAKDLTQDFLNQEVAMFPMGAHDDMLDADSELFNEDLKSIVLFPRLSTQESRPSPQPLSPWDL